MGTEPSFQNKVLELMEHLESGADSRRRCWSPPARTRGGSSLLPSPPAPEDPGQHWAWGGDRRRHTVGRNSLQSALKAVSLRPLSPCPGSEES